MTKGRPRALTAGESMALLDPISEGPLVAGVEFSLRVAGAESNFGIALLRLGVSVTWVSRLGADPVGDFIYRTLDDEGLDLSYVRRDPAPTGVFFKLRSQGKSSVLYYRRDSAASRLDPADVPDDALEGAALVHLTGITMALSDSARRTVIDVARRARARGVPILFDPNYRPALWSGPDEALAVQKEVLEFVDWYLCGVQEADTLWGTSGPESIFDALAAAGVHRSVVRLGAEGSLVRDRDDIYNVATSGVEEVVDEIGAGDGFAAGFAYGLIEGWRPPECAKAGHFIASHSVGGTGDWETFPHLDEIEQQLRSVGPTEPTGGGPR
jgi:2-dehydro-3-deoxygluconokinase